MSLSPIILKQWEFTLPPIIMEVENSPFGDKPHIFQDPIFHGTMLIAGRVDLIAHMLNPTIQISHHPPSRLPSGWWIVLFALHWHIIVIIVVIILVIVVFFFGILIFVLHKMNDVNKTQPVRQSVVGSLFAFLVVSRQLKHIALPETNMAPENNPVEVWRFLLETHAFLGASC